MSIYRAVSCRYVSVLFSYHSHAAGRRLSVWERSVHCGPSGVKERVSTKDPSLVNTSACVPSSDKITYAAKTAEPCGATCVKAIPSCHGCTHWASTWLHAPPAEGIHPCTSLSAPVSGACARQAPKQTKAQRARKIFFCIILFYQKSRSATGGANLLKLI